jgi:rubrerythrin
MHQELTSSNSTHANVHDVLDFAFSRRHFVRGSIAGCALGLAAVSGPRGRPGRAYAQELGDVEILEFALILEHMKARMYVAMLATDILSGKDHSYIATFAGHEMAHVAALSEALTQLGARPVQAQTAYNFPAFDTRDKILNFAKTVEDVAVGAYQGAAASLASPEILAAAGSIVQVEARHAAIVNFLLGQEPVPAPATSGLTVDQVNAIAGPILGL